MRGYSVTQRFLFPNSTVAAIPFVLTKYEEKTILQIMNLAAYANEANECDGINTQQKQGFAALNMGRKKGKFYAIKKFCFTKNSVFMFNFS